MYFITATVVGRKRVFTRPQCAQIVLGSLTWLRKEHRMLLFAFVLMPSHVHAVVKPSDQAIGDLLQDFGSFTAHALLARLKEDSEIALLQYFHDHKRDVRHEHSIWQDLQAKNLYTTKVVRQKVEYIHQNPVRGTRPLVRDRAEYVYSSACFYDRGVSPIIAVDDIREHL
jgi:REP element-mobilizing transposase RayT